MAGAFDTVDALSSTEDRDDDRPILGAGLTDLTGKQIGRYLIGQQLGSGGVATVYRAYDQVQGQTVALKLLLPGADDKAYTRFRNEAMTAGALRHPHIVRILQIGTAPQGEVAYIAMELVEGESLADLLRQRGRLRPEESANLLEPIARALAVAHSQGVVHRDVKPGNILLRPVSPGAPNSVQIEALEHPVVPLLTDFGIARALDAPELTNMGRTVGTPAYMAPEQCAGSREIDGRADIYALGAVLYRCIAGRFPFTGTTTQILHAHVYDPLTIEEGVYRQLSPLMVEVLQRSLAKRPEDRYTNASELADALAVAAGRTVRRADKLASDATATLTMTALPITSASVETSSTTVLVPAPGSAALRTAHPLLRTPTAGGAPAAPVAQSDVSLAPPTDARIVAPASVPPTPVTGASRRKNRPSPGSIVLTVVGGLIVVAIGILLGMQAPRMLRPAQSPAGVVAPVTATPSPPAEESTAFIDVSPTAVAIIASTAEPS
ncbi:MAG: protein kinase, partial [Caldilinea sp.]